MDHTDRTPGFQKKKKKAYLTTLAMVGEWTNSTLLTFSILYIFALIPRRSHVNGSYIYVLLNVEKVHIERRDILALFRIKNFCIVSLSYDWASHFCDNSSPAKVTFHGNQSMY